MKRLFLSCLVAISLQAQESVTAGKLEWQDNTEPREEIYKLAKAYCKQLHIGGKYDWRLPTAQELKQLSKDSKLKSKFQYLEESVYWSGDEDLQDDLNAMTIYIGNGFVSSSDKCEKYKICCVRNR